MQKWILQGKSSKTLPTVHIVSDSVGTKAQGLVRAAAACFEVFDPAIEILPRVSSEKEMISEIDEMCIRDRAYSYQGFFGFGRFSF